MGQRISDAAYRRATKLVEMHLTMTKGLGGRTTAEEIGIAIDEGFAPIRKALDEGDIDQHHPLVVDKTPGSWTSWFTQTLLKEGKACVENPSEYPTEAGAQLLKIMEMWGMLNSQGKAGGKKAVHTLGKSEPVDEEFPLA